MAGNERPVRFAIVGFGLGGSTFHAPFVTTTPGAALAAIVTRSDHTVAHAREQHPDVAIVPDVPSLASLDIDVAVVTTPNATHFELARDCVGMGLVTTVDKPLAATADAAEELIALAERTGVPLTCYQNRRWDGDYLTVLSLLDDLGPVHRFESRFERWRPEVKESWKEVPGPGSGILLDLASHLVDQALHLFGPAADLYGEVGAIRPGARVSDDAFLAIEHESGTVSHLWVSAVAGAPGPRFRVQGRKGAYVKRGMDPQEDALRAGGRPATPDWGRETPEHWGRLHAGNRSRVVETLPGNYGAFYAELVAALRSGGPMPVDPGDSVAALRLIEQASSS